MKAAVALTACVGVAALALAARPVAVDAQGASSDLTTQCASCHALTKPTAAEATLDRLWTRKGPDLWYAGDKFKRDWLVGWLQNPTVIRPGGTMWFKHAKAGDPRDTLDNAAVEADIKKHPKFDQANAEKLADALLALKSDGLVTAGAAKVDGANLMMGGMAFGKLRGCVACHQNKPGEGGLSGPELYDAGARLQSDYVLAYTKDPQAFDPHIWMPRLELTEGDYQNLTGYIASLGKENK